MGSKSRLDSVVIVLSVFLTIPILELVFAVPVSIQPNGRALRSVNANRRGSWDENPTTNLLLSPQQRRAVNSSGDGSMELDSDGDGDNGTFNNNTQVGSRLRQNETEPCSLEPASLCPTDPTHSNRDKEIRLQRIREYLLALLLGNKTRPPNKEIVRERFSGGVDSIPVSCDLPASVESEAWSSDRHFSLFFNLTSKYPELYGSSESTSAEQKNQQQESKSGETGQSHEYVPVIGSQPFATKFTVTPTKGVSIISAKLRLYKIGITEKITLASLGNGEPSEAYNDTEAARDDEGELTNVFSTRMTFPQFSPSAVDEKIRVSVFWYTQPATKNHYKKKLVDTKMLSVRESSWVEFDIKNAVVDWLNHRKPNYGLVVEVENETQDVLDPRKYFHGAPCFKPSEESEKEQMEGNDDNISLNAGESTPSTSPTIEICTLNVPETTTSYEQTKFFPIPINIHSLTHLQRVHESHARSSNSSKSGSAPWQSINIHGLSPEDFGNASPTTQKPSTVVLPTHRIRHHNHNSQNHNYNHSRGGFILNADHPLREILASVNVNSKEANKRGSQQFVESVGKGSPSHLFSEMPADEGRASSDFLDSTEQDREVIITKIVITPAQLKESGLDRFANRRRFFSSSSTSSPPTDETNVESVDR